uniref:BZIP domain-containing protein n=1 Tax=Rhodnius prolixus TaxID=13249 RepID=T1HVL7_RHOPR
MDIKAKLERSRQSARECRARKKLRYQYLEELVNDREKAVLALRKELDKYRSWNKELDEGRVPEGFEVLLEELGAVKQEMWWRLAGQNSAFRACTNNKYSVTKMPSCSQILLKDNKLNITKVLWAKFVFIRDTKLTPP